MRIETSRQSQPSSPVAISERRPSPATRRSGRAIAPVAGVLLIAITVVLAGGVVAAAIDGPADPAPTASLSLSAVDDRIAIDHRGGDALDAAELTVRVRIDDEPLTRQPPIPFFSAAGFHPGPTGPFNAASDDRWRVGETASFRVAGTNDPTLAPGRRVSVTVSVDGRPVAALETVVNSG